MSLPHIHSLSLAPYQHCIHSLTLGLNSSVPLTPLLLTPPALIPNTILMFELLASAGASNDKFPEGFRPRRAFHRGQSGHPGPERSRAVYLQPERFCARRHEAGGETSHSNHPEGEWVDPADTGIVMVLRIKQLTDTNLFTNWTWIHTGQWSRPEMHIRLETNNVTSTIIHQPSLTSRWQVSLVAMCALQCRISLARTRVRGSRSRLMLCWNSSRRTWLTCGLWWKFLAI